MQRDEMPEILLLLKLIIGRQFFDSPLVRQVRRAVFFQAPSRYFLSSDGSPPSPK